MAKLARVKSTLQEAASAKIVWESNPDFKIGKFGLNDFIAVHNATEELDKDYAKKEVELSGALGKRDEKARELHALVVRFRKGILAHFGPDSPEYGQSGGTRESQRKPSSRRARTAPDANTANTSPT